MLFVDRPSCRRKEFHISHLKAISTSKIAIISNSTFKMDTTWNDYDQVRPSHHLITSLSSVSLTCIFNRSIQKPWAINLVHIKTTTPTHAKIPKIGCYWRPCHGLKVPLGSLRYPQLEILMLSRIAHGARSKNPSPPLRKHLLRAMDC